MSNQSSSIIGHVIGGRFEVIELIGEGGMGEVFRGVHKPLGNPVAIKVLKPEHASDKKMVARFRREVRSTTRIQHQNVVQIYDSGQLDDGRLYLVMEFIEGQTLNELLDDVEFLPLERALRFLLQVADGMAAAHHHDIMHRDLKPENILIMNSPDGDIVKVLDLGLARMVESDNVEDKITMAGEIFGTPVYMSPEQCFGGDLDLTTDIYSFGIIAFECFCGEPPFEAANIVVLMLAHKNEIPPVPSQFFPEANIPKEVDDFILKCLSKDPAGRYKNGMELAVELRRIADLYIGRLAGAPADLPLERRMPSVELSAVGSGTSLTAGEVHSMVNQRLRDRVRRVCEMLRNYQRLSPSLAVLMAQLSNHETEILSMKQSETAKISSILEFEANLQRRTAQLRIAVQDLSYDRELLSRSITHNPNITVGQLKAIFPYIDEESAPKMGVELMEDISFQITSLERSINEAQVKFEQDKQNVRASIIEMKSRCLVKEKTLETMVYKIVQDLLGPAYNDFRRDPKLDREFVSLKIYYEEATRVV